jgi:hypothetical protein
VKLFHSVPDEPQRVSCGHERHGLVRKLIVPSRLGVYRDSLKLGGIGRAPESPSMRLAATLLPC